MLTRPNISEKLFEVGQTVVQGGQTVVQGGHTVVQGGQPFVHSRVSSTEGGAEDLFAERHCLVKEYYLKHKYSI